MCEQRGDTIQVRDPEPRAACAVGAIACVSAALTALRDEMQRDEVGFGVVPNLSPGEAQDALELLSPRVAKVDKELQGERQARLVLEDALGRIHDVLGETVPTLLGRMEMPPPHMQRQRLEVLLRERE